MSVAEIFDLITKYGPGVIFAVLWYLERGERIDAQTELKVIARDSTVALTAVEKTIDKWSSIFKPKDTP